MTNPTELSPPMSGPVSLNTAQCPHLCTRYQPGVQEDKSLFLWDADTGLGSPRYTPVYANNVIVGTQSGPGDALQGVQCAEGHMLSRLQCRREYEAISSAHNGINRHVPLGGNLILDTASADVPEGGNISFIYDSKAMIYLHRYASVKMKQYEYRYSNAAWLCLQQQLARIAPGMFPIYGIYPPREETYCQSH